MNNTDKLKRKFVDEANQFVNYGASDSDLVDFVDRIWQQATKELEALKSINIELQLQLEQEREIQKRSGLMLSAALRGDKRRDEPENSGRLDAVRAMREEITELTKQRDEFEALSIFMCETWTSIQKFVFEYCKDSISQYPMIQGTGNQFALDFHGEKTYKKEALHNVITKIKAERIEALQSKGGSDE
jgi:hypothetical protein